MSTQPLRITLAGREHVVEGGTTAGAALAEAVQDPFPEAKLGIGPPVENGFYYDVDTGRTFDPAELKTIEQRMRQIVKQGQRLSRRVVTGGDAREELPGEPYKLELIGLKGADEAPGADDLAADAVSFRYRDGSHRNGIPIGDAVAEIVTAVRDRVEV